MHPHSQDADRTSVGEETAATEPPTGPFSASAENGYRPTSRVSVPNPYTTRSLEIDDVDTGANPVGQWRGVGLNEPEPRSPHIPATTDTMTDSPTPSERAERPQAPVPPTAQAAHDPAGATRHTTGAHSAHEAARTEPSRAEPSVPEAADTRYTGPRADPYRAAAEPAAPPAPAPHEQRYPAPAQSAEPGREYRPAGQESQAPYGGHLAHQERNGHPGEWNQRTAPAHPEPYGHPEARPRRDHGGYPENAGYPEQGHGYPGHGYARPEPAPHAYPRPPHEAQGPAHYPGYAPQPPASHYPAYPPLPYQSAYPLPYQPPGYVLPGQPVVYPGQFPPYGQLSPYGQPVQHVIVLAAGQQPQVVTAESAATLLSERAEPTVAPELGQDRALTRSEPGTDSETDGGAAPEAEADPAPAPVRDRVEESAPVAPVAADATEVATPAADQTAPQDDLLNEALAGLAMRDLSLVDALLEMVESLETSAQDPDLLDKLFQIDNFATRMRRNGENFLVLTGHDGGESDAHDEIVPLLDVARAATSEIKDYPRVSLGKIPQTSITGLAADDISHLLAELLDNATANSPEHSQVVISARELDDGRLMIVVEDEGVGIPESQLAELNSRLDGEPVLDDEVPKHMGLYVASRIAEKHNLETRLESRSFRGVSAYTIVPKELLRVATPRTPGQSSTATIPSASPAVTSTGPIPQQSANGSSGKGSAGNGPSGPKAAPKPPVGGTSAVTAAGLPRRSATPHGSPLRMLPHPDALSDNPPPPPKGREDTPARLTGEARAEQIRDEIGDFLDGERAALDGEELEDGKE
ncbi:ATP-binding protein [Nocardiopsis sp. NPDC006938]|uniref:ATP-binding protein n=1 Tax=Nocardiopsis sp. NPDC006938 TaxID=3364337 RepID=UPI0036C2C7AF